MFGLQSVVVVEHVIIQDGVCTAPFSVWEKPAYELSSYVWRIGKLQKTNDRSRTPLNLVLDPQE
jgi:hypothetical protein